MIGSSPHTRGTPEGDLSAGRRGRLIPAHAGNTAKRLTVAARMAAHPRTRGEHGDLEESDLDRRGSSPHTRGTHTTEDLAWLRRRLIPAHAGNTDGYGVKKL